MYASGLKRGGAIEMPWSNSSSAEKSVSTKGPAKMFAPYSAEQPAASLPKLRPPLMSQGRVSSQDSPRPIVVPATSPSSTRVGVSTRRGL